MSAVITKPRAKSAKAAEVQFPALKTAEVRLREVREALRTADEKLEMAYAEATPGDAIETVLDLIAHNLLPEAVRNIHAQHPTRADAETVYLSLFTPLATLEAACALAAGSELAPALKEAYALLDWAQTECDSQNIGMLLPEPVGEEQGGLAVAESHGDQLYGAFGILESAHAIVSRCAADAEDELVSGVDLLMDHCQAQLAALTEDHALTEEKCNPVSAAMSVIDGVLNVACQRSDDPALWGALNLLSQSKTIVDAVIGSCMASERGRS
ncbi:hypothetical protein C7T35_15285 [Variovorax sp. WS11]|uniref:hypothetical protein n=1 Tax=Variovorax sp. WS11 TaxID=1105204 RepID=UPI000D0E242A|nr:hypothetical protein [Variovorax sp. WS11]NDZ12075.1 hypothetical protein [Variovorax sp. WS11]PSL83744.1 hypothetical protein C7T35_15285 [Variovorax sp. WS11]